MSTLCENVVMRIYLNGFGAVRDCLKMVRKPQLLLKLACGDSVLRTIEPRRGTLSIKLFSGI